jgi:two-component system, cell cycle response regulator
VAKPKILLVDDTRLVLELEKSFLKVSDVEVITAGNGVEALAIIRKDPPDLVFMDMNMPEMDGISCCSVIKSDPFLSEIPVVMLTTAGREADRERAAKAGCNDYITKPIDRREFLDMARKYTEAVDRREPRIPCRIPVLFLHGKSPVCGHALDLSDGGLFLATHELLRDGTPLNLALYLPSASPRLMQVAGRVAWANPESKRLCPALPAGVGVQFLDLDEQETAQLKAFIEAEQQKGSWDGTP